MNCDDHPSLSKVIKLSCLKQRSETGENDGRGSLGSKVNLLAPDYRIINATPGGEYGTEGNFCHVILDVQTS